jgi:hypothetical protein
MRSNSISKGKRAVSIVGETRGCWSVISRAGTMGDTSTWHCKASCCGRLAIITYRQLKNCPAMCQDCNRRRGRSVVGTVRKVSTEAIIDHISTRWPGTMTRLAQ